jgi:Fic family protein
MGHAWDFISDYEVDPADLAQPELKHLAAVWMEQRERLATVDAYKRFNERLHREWAIETGLIERLYSFNSGVTQLLIEWGIDAALIPHRDDQQPESVAAMINDHRAAVESIFQFVRGERVLSTSYIREMHALMTRNQEWVEAVDAQGRIGRVELIRGEYKRRPNNPLRPDGSIHEYCPPEHVAAEMDRLVEFHRGHVRVTPEVEAAWLHHRFTQIHPFQDGNGRIARALGTLVFVKAGWFPLVVRNDGRTRYLDALERADNHDLRELVRLFATLQKDELLKALSIARDVLRSVSAEHAIRAVRDQLQRRRDALIKEWNDAREIAHQLREAAENRLREVCAELQRQMPSLLKDAAFFVDGATDHGEKSHYFGWQITEAAKELGYYANRETFRSWTRLVMGNNDGDRTELLISFHGLGQEFQGVLACAAVCFQRNATEEDERQVTSGEPVCDGVFQINYKEPIEEVSTRFLTWLEPSLVRAVEVWQATL